MSLAGEGVPTACTTIEEVGSTGVGALTVGFIIFAVCAVVFLAKANTSGEQRKCVHARGVCGLAAHLVPSFAPIYTIFWALVNYLSALFGASLFPAYLTCDGHVSLLNIRYYICSTYICGFAAMAYFAMLSGQGWTAIAGCRQFFYARCDGSMPLRQLYLRQNYVVVACRQTYVVLLKRRWNDVGMLTWVS